MKRYCYIIIFCLSAIMQPLAWARVADHEISMHIIAQLARDNKTFALNIEVITNVGVVQLRGVVNTIEQGRAVIELAEATTDVQGVNASQLRLPFGKALPQDDVILAKIKGILKRPHSQLKINNQDFCSIEVNDGIVFLNSTANDTSQIRSLEKIIYDIKGVKGIRLTKSSGCKKTTTLHDWFH